MNKLNPWSGPFDTPLGLNQVFSLASPFITSCPASNPALPVTAFPTLAVSGTATPGKSVKLVFNNTGSGDKFLAVFTGLSTEFAKIGSDNTATLPKGLQGTAYAVVTNNGTSATDDTTVAGPTILSFPFNSAASN